MPMILRNFQQVCHYINMLLPFCELAFTDLMSAETKLVFNKGQLEIQLGKSNVDLAHRLGLISQAKIRGKYPQPKCKCQFLPQKCTGAPGCRVYDVWTPGRCDDIL